MKLAAAVLILLAQGGARGTDSLAGRVRQLVDSYVAAYFERHPDEATLAGVAGVRHDRWPDNSPNGIAHWWLRENAWLTALEATHAESLAGRPEWTAAGIMRDALEGSVGMRLCRFELWNVSHTNGGWIPTVTSLAAAQPVGTAAARPPLHRDRDRESTRGAAGRLHGAPGERADRADPARHPARDAARRIAAL